MKYYNQVVRFDYMFKSKFTTNGQSVRSIKNQGYSANPEKERQTEKGHGFQDRTYNQLPYTSPYKLNDPLSDTKRSLHQAIQMLESKRAVNRQAIEQVRSVNQQIGTSISTITPIKVSRYIYKDKTVNHDFTSKNLTPRSHFQWQEEDTAKGNKETQLTYENLNLRSRLNEELKRNNEMIKYVQYLQTQNQTLRSSQVTTNPNITALTEENRYLRSQLAASQGQNSFLTRELLAELEQLKTQNGQLRRDTVRLMRLKQNK